ncbi:hypothetical protein TNCV_1015251 [Trichonephila clavipes]|uniref:Uncharacterized protein n=1 Tax=Trichonephila clavipes TaxID=2585209 RepID=A0A8X6VXZ7_TRICX|nr:hypothetical protein TNCV_1015251 [Trichonephila clavipes]
MFDPSSFANPTPLTHADASRDVLPRGGTSQRLKLALKIKKFVDIPDIQGNVTRFLNSIPKEDFLQNFQDMYNGSQRCIVMGGDYFKGK